VVTDSGDFLPFAADGDDSRIHGGARIRFRINDSAEKRMAADVEVVCPSEQALAAEAAPWLGEFRRLIGSTA
jgi:hypothetical protein